MPKDLTRKLNVIETFVGCGGAHLGLTRAGFDSFFINDINPEMISTIKLNHKVPEDSYYVGSVENVSKRMILEKKKINDFNVDLLCGGIVCKGFSLAGVRNPSDFRNYLYLQQLRLVAEMCPKVSLIENVPQLKTTKILKETKENEEAIHQLRQLYNQKKQNNGKKTNQRNNIDVLEQEYNKICQEIQKLETQLNGSLYSVFDHIKELYKDLGYIVYDRILNCADYGDYTCRKRFFIVAVRDDIHKKYGDFKFPAPTHNKNGENGLPLWKTVGECFHTIDYDNLNHPEKDNDNRPMKHTENVIKRFSYIPKGGSLADIDKNAIPTELQTKKVFSSRGSCKRLDDTRSSPTLVPGHSAFPVHPVENRSITIREGACLTGFPNDYKFSGSHTKRCEQIGNAIPVNVAYHLGLAIRQYLENKVENKN